MGRYADLVIADAAVAYWRMLEAAGPTVGDSAGGHLDGTATGCTFGQPTLPRANPDGSIKFNGAGDVITVPDADALDPGAGSWTVEAWIKTASSANQFSKILQK